MKMRVFLILFFLMTTQAHAARIVVHKDSPSGVIFYLYDWIEKGDTDKLRGLLVKYEHRDRRVLFLNPPGGLLLEAMRLGYLIRAKDVVTAIGKRARCYSACPLIFFAGWDRYGNIPYRIKNPGGRLGLHHPYNEIKGKKRPSGPKAMGIIKRYFDHMHAGDGLFDLMKKTGPDEIAHVKNRTLSRLGSYQIRRTNFRNMTGLLGPAAWKGYARTVPLPVRRPMGGSYGVKIHSHVKPDAVELLRNLAGD